MDKACNTPQMPGEMTEVQRQRVIQANKVYCKACEENGIKVCSWENFTGWKDYVDGRINESQLSAIAEDELKQFRETFGKYTVVSNEPSSETDEEALKLERSKLANKIYRKVCTDSGLSFCFFKNFSTWSDYVQGKIGESEFLEKAHEEVQNMLSEGRKAH